MTLTISYRGGVVTDTAPLRRPIPAHQPGERRLFSLDPVLDLFKAEAGLPKATGAFPEDKGESTLAAFLGVSRNRIVRSVKTGVGANVADAIAVAVGRHPAEIWPDWYDYVPDDAEVEEADRLLQQRIDDRRRRVNRKERMRSTASRPIVRQSLSAPML